MSRNGKIGYEKKIGSEFLKLKKIEITFRAFEKTTGHLRLPRTIRMKILFQTCKLKPAANKNKFSCYKTSCCCNIVWNCDWS